jgi:hypothetical protein
MLRLLFLSAFNPRLSEPLYFDNLTERRPSFYRPNKFNLIVRRINRPWLLELYVLPRALHNVRESAFREGCTVGRDRTRNQDQVGKGSLRLPSLTSQPPWRR